MVTLISILSVVLFVVPILLGAGAWSMEWLGNHFYAEPLYTEEEYEQS